MKTTTDIQEKLRQFINWISIGILCVVLALLSLFRIGDAGIYLKPFPATWYGWTIWAILSFAPPGIGVMMLTAFRQEGIKLGHNVPEVKAARDAYVNLTAEDITATPRSKREYLKQGAIKDGTRKFITSSVLSVAVASIAISTDLSNFISLLVQLLVFLGGGFISLFRSMEYCTDELIVWYRREEKRIRDDIKKREELEKQQREADEKAAQEGEPIEEKAENSDNLPPVIELPASDTVAEDTHTETIEAKAEKENTL